jgi:hypothetical protein
MKQTITLIMLLTASFIGIAQDKSLKDQALAEFKKEHYNEAIGLLEKAVQQNTMDAEVYYYLGFFNHYRAYDSRPLSGYDYSYSKKIFEYLDKAISMDPSYGDARYFYGAECSGNAFLAMQNYDLVKLKYYYELAFQKGAYPPWLLEFGKNMLNSCDENAILFLGGNADFDVCSYLQLHKSVRTDITLIPIGNIDRPWYVQFLKKGLECGVRKIDIELTDQQIMDIHPFKWDTASVEIPVSHATREAMELREDFKLTWVVKPDLVSGRMQSKIESEVAKKRTFLSPQRAILLQIVEDNFSQRPLFFSNFANSELYGGLDAFFQNCGLVSRLTPIITEGTGVAYDIGKYEKLLLLENLVNYKTIKTNNLPRVSGIAVSGYMNAVIQLAAIYKTNNETAKLKALESVFTQRLLIGQDPENEKALKHELSN